MSLEFAIAVWGLAAAVVVAALLLELVAWIDAWRRERERRRRGGLIDFTKGGAAE